MLRISDFNISGKAIPQSVADKIYLFHAIPLNVIKDVAPGLGLFISSRSGYRSVIWEKSRGRKGDSEHTFKGKGAADVSCQDFFNNQEELLELLIKYTNYTRFAVYDSFIHCDYKDNGDGKRWVFNKKWQRVKSVK